MKDVPVKERLAEVDGRGSRGVRAAALASSTVRGVRGMGSFVYVFNLYSEPVSNLTVGGARPAASPGMRPARARRPTPRRDWPCPGRGIRAARPPSCSATTLCTSRGTPSAASPRSTSPRRAARRWSLDDPLLLLLAVNQATLLTTRGFVLASFPVSLGMGQASPVADSQGGRTGLIRRAVERPVTPVRQWPPLEPLRLAAGRRLAGGSAQHDGRLRVGQVVGQLRHLCAVGTQLGAEAQRLEGMHPALLGGRHAVG